VIGTNLTSPTTVDFGTASAAITASSATTATVTEPAGAAGTVNVTVTTAGGTSAAQRLWRGWHRSTPAYEPGQVRVSGRWRSGESIPPPVRKLASPRRGVRCPAT
jgi:hypothetical protein